jgi:linoleoyl-CoA desaturase
LFGNIENSWVYSALWIVMGLFMSGIGLSVMHDAIHGSYSNNKTVNLLMGEVINLVGGASINWKIQHNVLHHTYTNVDDFDEDIDSPFFLRFSPNKKRIGIHRFQYIYAWFFYGLITVNWAFFADFDSLVRYKRKGLISSSSKYSFTFHFFKITILRLAYFAYTIALPILLTEATVLTVVLNFFLMHFVAGVILSSIFQPAHVMEISSYSNAKGGEAIPTDWASHQVMNTVNFATKNKLFTWFVGGLNHQVEHHLFPSICHVHYTKLSRIVRETAEEFNLPYHSLPTFRSAIWSHMKMLKQLGKV